MLRTYCVGGRAATTAAEPRTDEPERPTPCPHAGCTGVLVRLASGVVRCTRGHTGKPDGGVGHISYD